MFSSMRSWGPGKLAASWAAYWITLGAVTLWEPITTAIRLAKLPENHADISFGFENTLFHLTMNQDKQTVYAGTVHLATVVFWIAAPPLLLWLIWLLKRPSRAPTAAKSDSIPVRAPDNELLRISNALNDPNIYNAPPPRAQDAERAKGSSSL